MKDIMEELKDIRHLQKSINLDREKQAMYEAQIGLSTSVIRETGSRAHKENDIIGEQVSKMLDYLEELNTKIIECEERKRKAEARMLALSVTQFTLMRLRYFEGMKWKDVAKEMNFSIRDCFYIHGKAIEALNSHILTLPEL